MITSSFIKNVYSASATLSIENRKNPGGLHLESMLSRAIFDQFEPQFVNFCHEEHGNVLMFVINIKQLFRNFCLKMGNGLIQQETVAFILYAHGTIFTLYGGISLCSPLLFRLRLDFRSIAAYSSLTYS